MFPFGNTGKKRVKLLFLPKINNFIETAYFTCQSSKSILPLKKDFCNLLALSAVYWLMCKMWWQTLSCVTNLSKVIIRAIFFLPKKIYF